jgi:hypothetical protein
MMKSSMSGKAAQRLASVGAAPVKKSSELKRLKKFQSFRARSVHIYKGLTLWNFRPTDTFGGQTSKPEEGRDADEHFDQDRRAGNDPGPCPAAPRKRMAPGPPAGRPRNGCEVNRSTALQCETGAQKGAGFSFLMPTKPIPSLAKSEV